MGSFNEERGALIVTGGSRGIGAAVAQLAAARGYSVAVNFSNDEAAADGVVRQIQASGGRAVAIRADISAEEEVVALFRRAEERLGKITGLVNNAGVTGGLMRTESVSGEMLRRVFEVNVVGSILCARGAVRSMSTRNGGSGGAIVNLSSLAARTGGGGDWVHYAASKGAIQSFTVGLAREVATEGIRVNAVAPGLIETGIHASAGDPQRVYRMAATVPMQRPGTPAEVAEGVVWLLSPAASYITGAILEIGGGRG